MIASAMVLMLLTQDAPPSSPQVSMRVYGGVQTGFPHVLGITGRAGMHRGVNPWFDLDLKWEPSAFLQSYSLGGAWRPFDGVFSVGGRVRWLQFGAPWARGSSDSHLGLGLETGWHWGLLQDKRLVLSAGLHATWVPTQAANLQALFGVQVGIEWSFIEVVRPQ